MLKWFRNLFTKRHIVKLDLTAIVNNHNIDFAMQRAEVLDAVHSLQLDVIAGNRRCNMQKIIFGKQSYSSN